MIAQYFTRFLNSLNQNKEISIIIMIIFVLFMMIVPLTPGIMDVVIGFNISVTVLVLMVVLYMQSAIAVTSFPSILLVLALLRIGITVSTSRLILLNADAGEIVTTFGQFVAGGNLVVGIIIFVTITIINFIVVIKGSERVAEVAARFSLDAMPGKQMSIDSDLKAGNITMEEANLRRKNLGLESKLYGAMDGALKFVKGDAIASIIDILINLVGGLLIGILQKGMSFADAASLYSILTIGDGLVQQVPALLISLTSGLMITKVNDDDLAQNVGQNILQQIFSNHKSLFAACVLMLLLAIVPGMPSMVFIAITLVFVVIGIVMYKKGIGSGAKKEDAVVEDLTDSTGNKQVQLHMTPLGLYFAPKFRNTAALGNLKNVAFAIRQDIANDLGVLLPQIVIRYDNTYQENNYRLEVFEIPEVTGEIYWDKILILDPEVASYMVFEDRIDNTYEFGETSLGFWVDKSYQANCEANSIAFLNCEQFLKAHIGYHVNKHVSEFLGIQEVKEILDRMQNFQELIKELLRMLPLNKIAEVFQRLVGEGVSLRNFKVILDTMLEWGQREKDSVIITEYVRRALGKYIAYKFSKGSYLFSCIILSYEAEDVIRDSIRYSDTGSYLALDPRVTDSILAQVREIVANAHGVKNLVIVSHFDIRRYIRSVVEFEFGMIPVLSFQELEGYAEFNNLGVIEVE